MIVYKDKMSKSNSAQKARIEKRQDGLHFFLDEAEINGVCGFSYKTNPDIGCTSLMIMFNVDEFLYLADEVNKEEES